MGIIATDKGKPRMIPPTGNHIARCIQMVHIGTNYDNLYQTEKNVVRITFELPDELRVFDESKGEQPFFISREYTLSLNEKANLRKDLDNWRGKPLTDDECKAFDLTVLVGVPAMVNVVHVEKSGSKYANIGSITPIPKGMQVPPQISESLIWDFDNNFEFDVLESFPDFIKDRIKSSNEYEDRTNQLEGAAYEQQLEAGEPHSDEFDGEQSDLPF